MSTSKMNRRQLHEAERRKRRSLDADASTTETLPKFQYPGVNLSLREELDIDCYWRSGREPDHAIGFPEAPDSISDVLPMTEVAMMMLMDNLTDKPDWHSNVFVENIVQKWRDEAREQSKENIFLRIMQGKERHRIPQPRSRIISERALKGCNHNHPPPPDLTAIGLLPEGVGLAPPSPKGDIWSNTYQWLPANVAFRDDGSAKLTSYVNNLHPTKFPEIYETLERVIDKAISAWDQCLRETRGYGKDDLITGRSKSRFQDPTRPGHRRFIALWLVDPHRRIVSTANVPPQKRDWWSHKASLEPDTSQTNDSVPEGLMSVEAKEHRLKLMDERTAAKEMVEYEWWSLGYSFCEH
ncbi:hypothetical protein FOBRF1_006988 [Fusarium oxysporum]